MQQLLLEFSLCTDDKPWQCKLELFEKLPPPAVHVASARNGHHGGETEVNVCWFLSCWDLQADGNWNWRGWCWQIMDSTKSQSTYPGAALAWRCPPRSLSELFCTSPAIGQRSLPGSSLLHTQAESHLRNTVCEASTVSLSKKERQIPSATWRVEQKPAFGRHAVL